jgi:hypothetical protein
MVSRADQRESDLLPLGPSGEGMDAGAELRRGSLAPAEGWDWPVLPRVDRRTFREKVVDALRRAWEGPPPEPLTDEEWRMIMRPRPEDDVPDRVPRDDPARLAWEAELRSMGIRPAKNWTFPDRKPRRRPSLWERLRYRASRGW